MSASKYSHNLLALYAIEICSGLARGSLLVCIGWTTLIVVGDVAAVGQVFISSMITTILAAPFIAVIVDRYNRKYLTIISHLGMAIALFILGIAIRYDSNLSLIWFFVVIIFATFLRILYNSAHDGIIHANTSHDQLLRMVARFRGIHLLTTAIGTVLTGFLIETFSSSVGFIFSGACSILLVIAAAFIRGVTVKENVSGVSGFMSDFKDGLGLVRNNQVLRNLALLAGVALPVGQLSNAILSSFIRDDLGRGSDIFGLVDAAWPVGGMMAALVLGSSFLKIGRTNMEYMFAILVGVVTVVFSYCTSVITLFGMHALMGFTVWVCRIVIDSRILQICTSDTVGRSKAYIEFMFSVVAMIMCFSPTVVKSSSASSYFLFWGVVVVVSSLVLWTRQPKLIRSP
ncbi:MAG: MFS family permease [Gammaproteobacteria bacterium]